MCIVFGSFTRDILSPKVYKVCFSYVVSYVCLGLKHRDSFSLGGNHVIPALKKRLQYKREQEER